MPMPELDYCVDRHRLVRYRQEILKYHLPKLRELDLAVDPQPNLAASSVRRFSLVESGQQRLK